MSSQFLIKLLSLNLVTCPWKKTWTVV